MPVTIVCERCGCEKTVKKYGNRTQRFCSKTCAYAFRRYIPEVVCEWCKTVYRPANTADVHRFCSIPCYAAYRQSLSPDERAALMAEATSRIRGSKRSHDDLCKRARTKQDRAVLSGDEAAIMDGFIAAGLAPVPLFAVDKFNIDFAFPEQRIAVEYHGGNWHNTPEKREQDDRKRRYLESIGWTVRTFPRIDKPQANDAGNQRITVAELVREVAVLLHHRSPIT